MRDLELHEVIEDKIDIELDEKTIKDDKYFSLDEILDELGISREELTKPVSKTRRKPTKVA